MTIEIVPVDIAAFIAARETVRFFFPLCDQPEFRFRPKLTKDRIEACQAELRSVQGRLAGKYGKPTQDLWLRATPPGGDVVGWHKESFYNNDPRIYNFWLPLWNVCLDNTLKYIPGSESIPKSELGLELADARPEGTDWIGLPPKELRITKGVDFSTAKPLIVLPGQAAIFSGDLIHGCAENHTDKVRFSIDFRISR